MPAESVERRADSFVRSPHELLIDWEWVEAASGQTFETINPATEEVLAEVAHGQGSGSGHEPAHVMVVGRGMLDAACPGDVFAAPPSDYVYETTKLLASPKGVLHIINNYTGDRMSFDMGRELAEAEDIKIATIVVDDDVAVKDSTYTVGRRGVAGNFFVIKAVGAASERGAELDDLVKLGERVNSVTRTMGMALTSCTPPARAPHCSARRR